MGSIDKQDVDWALEFNPFFEVTQQETANLRKTHMETDTGYINAGVLDPTDIAKSRFSERGWEPDIRPVDIDEVSARSALIEAEAELEAMSLAAETETAQTEAEIAEEELTEPATPEAEDEPDTQAQSGAE